ncbi:MAG: hypothetical protein ACRDGN_05375 [bacterium]
MADTVWAVLHHQQELVQRLPVEAFRNAVPNEGHLLAAALLYEGALNCVMTLNFNLAFSHALRVLGAEDVSVIEGPADYGNLGLVNLIYLHRSANADYEEWILRTDALNNQWHGNWQGVVAARFLASPVTVFAGLGARATVLIETTRRIRDAVTAAGVAVYQIDPVDRAHSAFFAALEIPDASYIQMGWCEFMTELAGHVCDAQIARLSVACNEQLVSEHLPHEDVPGLSQKVRALGLLGLGAARARWRLSDRPYLPHHPAEDLLFADLVLTVGLVERTIGGAAIFSRDGVVEFRHAERLLGVALLASGRGVRGWSALEAKIRASDDHWRYRNPRPRHAIVSGVQGQRPATTAPPLTLTAEAEPGSILFGDEEIQMLAAIELRADPTRATAILG